jgi:hypothetical protein
MRTEPVHIRRGEVVRIRDGCGALVAVANGAVWLTQHHDPRDIVIEAGGEFRLDRPGTAIVSTDSTAWLTVLSAADAARPAIETAARAPRAARLALAY